MTNTALQTSLKRGSHRPNDPAEDDTISQAIISGKMPLTKPVIKRLLKLEDPDDFEAAIKKLLDEQI